MSLKKFSFLSCLPTMIGAAISLGSFGVELKIFVQFFRWIPQDKKIPTFFFPVEDIWILLTCSQSSFPVFVQRWLLL